MKKKIKYFLLIIFVMLLSWGLVRFFIYDWYSEKIEKAEIVSAEIDAAKHKLAAEKYLKQVNAWKSDYNDLSMKNEELKKKRPTVEVKVFTFDETQYVLKLSYDDEVAYSTQLQAIIDGKGVFHDKIVLGYEKGLSEKDGEIGALNIQVESWRRIASKRSPWFQVTAGPYVGYSRGQVSFGFGICVGLNMDRVVKIFRRF